MPRLDRAAPLLDAPVVGGMTVGVPPVLDVDGPIGGLGGMPMVGVVGVPIVGVVGVPMLGVVGVPIVGNVGVPMAGDVGVPIVDEREVPRVGSVGVPVSDVLGMPMVGVSDVPIVGCVGVPIDVPIVGRVGVPMVGESEVPIIGIVAAPVPSVGDRPLTPGMSIGTDGNVVKFDPGNAELIEPRLLGVGVLTDCAWTSHGIASSAAGTIHSMILFIRPPCSLTFSLSI